MLDTDLDKLYLECPICGEKRRKELFVVIPLKTKHPYVICRYCSALGFELKEREDSSNG